MADEQDQSQKTEDPTQKRLDDAQKKGQTVTSREVNNFFILLALTFLIMILAPRMMTDIKSVLSGYITMPDDIDIDEGSFQRKMSELLLDLLIIMTVPFLMFIGAVIAANVVQNRFIFSSYPIQPRLEKISVIKGIGRLFSRRTLVEFLKGIIKISIIGAVVMVAVAPYQDDLNLLTGYDIFDLMAFIGTLCGRVMVGVCIIMFFIAALDFFYQKFEYMQNLRMSKQEIKDEYKQQEGDPHIKQKLRQIRRERLAKQMMAQVPEADVIVTNPTHYAIALKYDSLTMTAPKIIAKGKDKVALRIKEAAEKHKIIVMRNPPLARLLFDNGKLDEEIPFEYYKAVAEIIGYVYKLRGHKMSKPL